MAHLISINDIEHIRTMLHLPHLEVVLRPDWGSSHTGYREEIHGELKKKMAKAYPFSDSSISHCRDVGGFAMTIYSESDSLLGLGFDLEENHRVTDVLARRICRTEEEFQKAPSWVSLWTAKEAAFKCLKGPQQPKVVSDIELEDWRIVDSQLETVHVKNPQHFGSTRIHGVLLKKPAYTLAFFVR